jgi:hypothetical protein
MPVTPTILAVSLFYFRESLKSLLLRITATKFLGLELTALAQSTKIKTETLLSTDADFDKIENLLDWNKVAAKVREWAAEHGAANPSDMGPDNFRRFLHDVGLPGGAELELEREPDGTLKCK